MSHPEPTVRELTLPEEEIYISDVAATLGSNVGWYFSQSQLLVVLGPEHAATVAGDGFNRADVQRFVF